MAEQKACEHEWVTAPNGTRFCKRCCLSKYETAHAIELESQCNDLRAQLAAAQERYAALETKRAVCCDQHERALRAIAAFAEERRFVGYVSTIADMANSALDAADAPAASPGAVTLTAEAARLDTLEEAASICDSVQGDPTVGPYTGAEHCARRIRRVAKAAGGR